MTKLEKCLLFLTIMFGLFWIVYMAVYIIRDRQLDDAEKYITELEQRIEPIKFERTLLTIEEVDHGYRTHWNVFYVEKSSLGEEHIYMVQCEYRSSIDMAKKVLNIKDVE